MLTDDIAVSSSDQQTTSDARLTSQAGVEARKRRRVTRPAGGPTPLPQNTLAPTVPSTTLPSTRPAFRHAAEVAQPTLTIPATPEPAARNAATTLVFQAPDITPRPSRRAQAPAGPPRVHSVIPAEPEQLAPEPELVASPAPAKQSRANTRANSKAKKAEKPVVEKPAGLKASKEAAKETERVETAADGLSGDPKPRLLTKAENTAAKEVAAIEAELKTDIATFAPEDLVVDSEDVELDNTRRRRRRGGRGRRTGGKALDGALLLDDDGAEIEVEAVEIIKIEKATPTEPRNIRRPVTVGVSDTQHPDVAEADTGVTGIEATEAEDEAQEATAKRRRRRGTKADRADRIDSRAGNETPSSYTPSRTGNTWAAHDEVTALKGSTRLEAKRQRRREGRATGRRRQIITEAEFLARRENVDRKMVVRQRDGRTQVAVLEDGILVEHYVAAQAQTSLIGNIYLGRVQNVLPSMEAAFVDIGRGRNAVLYAGEVNWDAAGLDNPNLRRIESALKSGDSVLVQVTKDPIGQKGARLTSQITLAGRYLVLVPGGGMTGISRKLPEPERFRLKKLLREIVPNGFGVIVRTAAAGASEDELRNDVGRLTAQWDNIQEQTAKPNPSAPVLIQGEPDLAIRVVRDIFNDDFTTLIAEGHDVWREIADYVEKLAPDLKERVQLWHDNTDVFSSYRIDEQLAKGLDRKVWLPSGGSLVIDRTEAMTVIDVNTGKFTGVGGTLEETVTRNNLEAAEEIVRQLRLRDIGGIVVIDFIDMVLENNRDLVLRRLVECLARDRTKHQVAEVTSLGLVQMTRKRVGQGLLEAFSEPCEECRGRGFTINLDADAPDAVRHDAARVDGARHDAARHLNSEPANNRNRKPVNINVPVLPQEHSEAREAVKATLATIAAAAAHAHEHEHDQVHQDDNHLTPQPIAEERFAWLIN